MQEYADPVIDWLDAGRGILARRFFREVSLPFSSTVLMYQVLISLLHRYEKSCTQLPHGAYTKDLSIVDQVLSLVCLVDNSPVCYTMNEGESWCFSLVRPKSALLNAPLLCSMQPTEFQ